jgi:hypothetical protein
VRLFFVLVLLLMFPIVHAAPSQTVKILSGDEVALSDGDNWREDFTVSIIARDLAKFKKANIDPFDYKGKTIQVRGWVKREFGPMIVVTQPEQIEVIKARPF